MIAFAGTPCKSCYVGWPTDSKWMGLKIHGYRAKSDSFLWANLFTFFFLELEYDMDVITFWLLVSFWRLVPSYFHGRSRPSGTTSSMARWRPSNPCFWPFQSLRRCALLMNKAWLRNHRRFRNRDLETTAQELPFRNYGSCTKVQELWFGERFPTFSPTSPSTSLWYSKGMSCRRHFVRVQHMSFYEHLCNCHYIQSFSPLAWIGMSFC